MAGQLVEGQELEVMSVLVDRSWLTSSAVTPSLSK